MGLFAIAGGAPPSGEGMCCCSLYLVLPLVLLLSAMSAARESFGYAMFALGLAGSLLGLVLVGIAGYEPSDDWEVADEQAMGRWVALMYAGVAAIPVVCLLYVAVRRGRKRASSSIELLPIELLPPDERITTAPTREDRITEGPFPDDQIKPHPP